MPTKVLRAGRASRKSRLLHPDWHASTASGHAKELLHGLRNTGNMGAHGHEVTKKDVFDAVDVLEDVLRGSKEKGSINAKAQKLLGKKGTP